MKCLKPSRFSDPKNRQFLNRCGQCTSCRIFKKSCWKTRLILEQSEHLSSCFLTLTYDDTNRPGALIRKDADLFIRRLQRQSQGKIRYYYIGEHGEKTGREHWHMLIFGSDIEGFGMSRLTTWPPGNVYIGTMTAESIGYTTGYLSKLPKAPVIHGRSNRPGIGKSILWKLGRKAALEGADYSKQVPNLIDILGKPSPLDYNSRKWISEGWTSVTGKEIPPNGRPFLTYFRDNWENVARAQWLDEQLYGAEQAAELYDTNHRPSF